MTAYRTFDALSTLLDEEYNLVKTADFSGLVKLADKKKFALDTLSDDTYLNFSEIESLKQKAGRNAELLNGAISGFNRALDTFIGRNVSQNSVKTYGSNGDVSQNESGLSRIVGYF